MTRPRHKLTAKQVASSLSPGRYSDGGGLYLLVDDAGRKRWVWRFKRGQRGAAKATELGLGTPVDVSLARARELAEAMRAAVRAGLDPRTVRQAAAPKPTFGEIATDYIATHRSGWKNPKHAAQWETTFRVYAAGLCPVPVDQVALTHVLEVLKPLWLDLPETATRVRSRIELVLDAAAAKGHRPNDNPARWKGSLKHWLSAPQRLKRGHMAAVPYREIPDVIARLRGLQSVSARALEFLILTAARTNEVRGLIWSDLDLEAKVWTIPKERMKGKREHRVPLTDRALEIIAGMEHLSEPYVFPGKYRGDPLSDIA